MGPHASGWAQVLAHAALFPLTLTCWRQAFSLQLGNPVCRHPGVGGGVGSAQLSSPLLVAAADYHCGRHGWQLVLRAPHLVPVSRPQAVIVVGAARVFTPSMKGRSRGCGKTLCCLVLHTCPQINVPAPRCSSLACLKLLARGLSQVARPRAAPSPQVPVPHRRHER